MFDDNRAAASILQATDPGEQKFLAKNIKGFNVNTWNGAKDGLRKDILHCKFEQHPNLAKKLCETWRSYSKRHILWHWILTHTQRGY